MRQAGFAIGLGLALLAAACGSGADGDAPPAASAAAATTPGYFTVTPEQMAHLETTPVSQVTWDTRVLTTGTVDWDGDHTTQVITQVSGPITRLAVDVGAHVKAGDPLLYVASPDVSNAIAAYRKAANRLDLAKRNLDRSRDLLAHKAIAQRDLESAEADYNDAATDVQTAQQQLTIYGVTPADVESDGQQDVPIRPELALRAPIGGTVVQRLVLPGQVIAAGSTLAFVITDVSTVWIQGHVYEKDLQSVHVGDTAEIHSASFPDTFDGTIAYVGALIDPATRTTPVRIVTRNPRAQLKKDLFVDVTIHDRSSHPALVVPTAAVLYDDQNFPFVYVQVQPRQFAQRKVDIGGQRDDRVEVIDGVKAGDRVVSQGSVFLQFANSYRG
jgi:cobalt-zinc-cadmium efflux system membrane fusion protein